MSFINFYQTLILRTTEKEEILTELIKKLWNRNEYLNIRKALKNSEISLLKRAIYQFLIQKRK